MASVIQSNFRVRKDLGQVRKIIEGLGLDIATPDEARDILALKGGDRVGF